YRVRDLAGGAGAAALAISALMVMAYLGLILAFLGDWAPLVIGLFVGLAVLQNLWLPLFLQRIDDASDRAAGATLLSVDAQARSIYIMLVAPVLGWSVDHCGLWSIGLVGVVASTLALWQRETRLVHRQ
ncbi:MAG: hypothetical protein AAF657_36830, partial [Acidobacteriota bacterium]